MSDRAAADARGCGPRARRSLRRACSPRGRYTGVLIGFAVDLRLPRRSPSRSSCTWANWQNIIRSQSVVLTLGLGMTFVVLTGGIDLSIASATTAASAMILGISIEHGASWWLGCSRPRRRSGSRFGLANGLVIGVLKIPFFVVTLGTLSIYQSIRAAHRRAARPSRSSRTRASTRSQTLINGNVGPVPDRADPRGVLYRDRRVRPALHAVRPLGLRRRLEPRGRPADRLNVTPCSIAVYAISGLSAGLAAIVQTGRLTAASPQVDPNLMLTVIAAVLIGGTAFTGGDGGLLGTVDRRPLPRHRPERAPAQRRLDVLAGHGQRADPDPRRRHRRAPRPRRDRALARAALAATSRERDAMIVVYQSQARQSQYRRRRRNACCPSTARHRSSSQPPRPLLVCLAVERRSPPTTIGESSPVLSNPNQQAITRGEHLAAKTLRLEGQDARREPVARQAGLRRRHARQPRRQGPDHLDARRGRRRRRLQARARQEHPVIDYGSTSNVTSSVFDERGYRLHGGREGRRVHRQARTQGRRCS